MSSAAEECLRSAAPLVELVSVTKTDDSSVLAPEAQPGRYAFESCLTLVTSITFPSLLQLRLRIEVPLWRDLTTARRPAADLPAEENSASDATESAERSPRLALPVPVGLADTLDEGTEEATEEEDMADEPSDAFAKGYGRFGIGYTRRNSSWQFRAQKVQK